MIDRTQKAIKYCKTAKVFNKTDFNSVLKAFYKTPDTVGQHKCSGCLYGFILKVQKRFKNSFPKEEFIAILKELTKHQKRLKIQQKK